MQIDLEETFTVGQDTFFESVSPTTSFAVTFEDDLNTGYFYAVDTTPNLEILDALHIYNVEDVKDKHKPCKIQIVWTDNGQIVFLLINGYCHALFDFHEKAGYCRTGFPESTGKWAKIQTRTLTDNLIDTLTATEKS